jgi:KaiC/GvpD/RAD55 family RecA-like ATPase
MRVVAEGRAMSQTTDLMAFSDDEAADEELRQQERRRRPRQANGHDEDWRKLELVRFADMRPRLDGRPLVRGLIERDQISVIYGEAGCGKTFLALDLALHIAAGLNCFGRKVEQGAVVYVAAEAGRSIINRVVAWRTARGLDKHDLPFAVVTSSIDLCHAEAGDIERLIEAIRAAEIGPIVLVIIDTVSRVLAGGNENSPDDMGALVRSLDRLRDELRCHVGAVHHAGKDTSKGSRGHSLLRCAVDTEVEVARDDATGISIATVTKQRDGPTEGQIAFRLRQIELGRDQDDEPVTSCVVEPTEELPKGRQGKLSPAQARILELLVDAIARNGQTPPANGHIPANTACVSEQLWRECCYQGQITASDDQGAKQKAFKRAAEALIARGRVGKWGELVWAVGE